MPINPSVHLSHPGRQFRLISRLRTRPLLPRMKVKTFQRQVPLDRGH